MTDTDTRDKMFEFSRIPRHLWDTKLSSEPGGVILAHYIMGDDFKQDIDNGFGVNLWSTDATKRVRVFPLFARALVLRYVPVKYVSLLSVSDITMADNHPLYDDLANAPLAVQGMCDSSKEFPFTPMERYRIEQFLMDRSDRGIANFYSCQSRLGEVTVWWSDNFIRHQQQCCRDVEI